MGLIRRLRRPRILRDRLVPDETWKKLLGQHPILKGFVPADERRLRELTTLFLHEKNFSAAEGIELDDHLRAVIAVQACLPVLGLDIDWYANWRTVVVVPDVFTEEYAEPDEAGVVHEYEEEKAGLSWDDGPVVLSWEDIEASGWGDGYNVVVHEAAHRLDQTDGAVNGCPALHQGMDPEEWRTVFSGSFYDLHRRTGGRRRGRSARSKIDDYAVESPAEFFAVASEYFFEKPGVLLKEYPDVHRLLAAFYRQDTASRLVPAKARR